jgi:hypothetical protein
MSLESWLANRWLLPREASGKEIDDLLEAARHDLKDARPGPLSYEATRCHI